MFIISQVGGFKLPVGGVSPKTVDTSGIRTQNQSHGHSLCVALLLLKTPSNGLVAVRVRPGFEKSYPLNHDDHGKNPFTPVLWYKANALSIFAPLCYFRPIDVMSIIRTLVLGTEYNLDQSSNQIFHGVVTLGSMKESRIVQATIPIKM